MQKYQEYYLLLQESLVSLSFIAGALWLIAGIMLLVRKPQTQNDQINSQYSNDIHSHVVPEEKKREQQQYNMNEPHIGQSSTSHHDHALNDQNKRENHNHDNQPYK